MLLTRTRLGTSIDNTLAEQLKYLSKNTRIPVSRLMDEAIEDLLNKFKLQQQKINS